MPPRPRRIEFPPTRLLFDIKPKEETPSRTPWWLTLLRLAAAALVILAAAGPIWNPQTGVGGSNAPLVAWIVWGIGALMLLTVGGLLSLVVCLLSEKQKPQHAAAA